MTISVKLTGEVAWQRQWTTIFVSPSAAESVSTQHGVQGILEFTRASGSDPLCRPRQQHCTTGFRAFRKFILATSVPAFFVHFSPFYPCHSLHRKLQQLSGSQVRLLSLPHSQFWGLSQIMSSANSYWTFSDPFIHACHSTGSNIYPQRLPRKEAATATFGSLR